MKHTTWERLEGTQEAKKLDISKSLLNADFDKIAKLFWYFDLSSFKAKEVGK